MSVLTQFDVIGSPISIDVEMPAAVQVGDEVDLYSIGHHGIVRSVAWKVVLDDQWTEEKITLIARVDCD